MRGDGPPAAAAPPATDWANGDPPDTLDVLAGVQRSLPISLIETPRRDFVTCRPDMGIAEALGIPGGFDHLPVEDGRGRMVGLLDVASLRGGGDVEGAVRDRMAPLSEDTLIGAGAGILDFVRDADRHPCRLVVAGTGVSGLVTLSDLQRLPVRAALFTAITHLEMTMAAAIRREFWGTDAWMDRLSRDRRDKVLDAVVRSGQADNAIENLLFTQFADKIVIVTKSPGFSWPREAARGELKRARRLRDDLAHANEYAATREAAGDVCRTLRLIEAWAGKLAGWPAAPAALRR